MPSILSEFQHFSSPAGQGKPNLTRRRDVREEKQEWKTTAEELLAMEKPDDTLEVKQIAKKKGKGKQKYQQNPGGACKTLSY